jgi:hypothetical protein
MDADLVRGLRARGIDILTAIEARMLQRSDEDHLGFATAQGRALYSFNIADFHAIHADWMARSQDHSGIILAQQTRYSVGEQIRRIIRLTGSISGEEMKNREEFLNRW